MCSETSPPRLSFSHDLSELQILPIKQDVVPCNDTLFMDSNSDFEFITNNTTLEFESCSADELFSNGMILPIQIQKDKTTTTNTRKYPQYVEQQQQQQQQPHHHTKLPPRPFSPNVADKIKKETIRELLLDVSSELHEKKPHSNKSFWGFSRSKSLNCDAKKSLICSLPLLSRSNSTGSTQNPKKMSSIKHQSASKSWPPQSSSSSTTTTSSSYSVFNFYPVQKSNSGKSYGGSYGNGVRISPVLNVPTPYVSKGSTNLFGLGSFLRVGKVKKNKK